MDIDSITKNHKKRLNKEVTGEKTKSNYFKNLLTRTLLAIILTLAGVIFYKSDTSNKELINKYLYEDSWNFMKTKNFFEDKIGRIIPIATTHSQLVSTSSDFTKNDYKINGDLTIFSFKEDLPISTLCGGIVVFIGNKDNLGNTIIIQGNDGVDIWYSNITNSNVKLYDYLEKDTLIGESVNKNLTLKFSKDGKFISYDEYIK